MVVEPRVVRRFGLREQNLPLICITEGVRDPPKGSLEIEGHSGLHIEHIELISDFHEVRFLWKTSTLWWINC